jgi:hypothetical protein
MVYGFGFTSCFQTDPEVVHVDKEEYRVNSLAYSPVKAKDSRSKNWLVVWNMTVIFPYIGNNIPI